MKGVGSTSHWISVFMGHLATIPITGTGINPARSFEQPLSSTRASHGMTTYDLLLSPFLFN
ncbi:hypothetical protein Bca52824_050562 [Brassica carinata]|uniref:Uncharacterized protein n=1 Tax=Brassica carinata TaxID=52824 RepID=A0A8X7R0Q6_BRACI|nr:hypothetical protein Bca52824_050562 [Brassica carinata]